ncbi:MAG: flagellar biosynthesis protein FlhF [Planctomycetes bacterium]|nr:flagellar biosynthesis protein FlhF [Planctomycetota bacterium]
MQLKTYRAPSMAEALAQVKKDLGSEAVILHTRSYKAGGIAGVGARSVVEITASDQAPRTRPARTARNESARKPVEVLSAVAGKPAPQRSVELESFRPTDFSRVETQTSSRSAAVETSATKTAEPVSPTRKAEPIETGATLQQPLRQPLPQSKQPAVLASSFAPPPAMPTVDASRAIEDELASIKRLIGQVLATSSGIGFADGPASSVRSMLLRQGLDQAVVSEAVHEASSKDPGPAMPHSERVACVQRGVIEHLARRLRTSGSLPVAEIQSDGRPLTLALIGPTGVGKTTTIAKLAAHYRLKQGKRVGLVTADTYRIAAVEQLRVYADIIRLPLKVAMTPEELAEACRVLAADSDVILIDTAGRSPTDAVRLAELDSFLRAARPHQTHLVLSAVLGEQSLARSLGRFEAMHPTHILLSKLDESASLAPVFNLLGGRRIPVGCVTTGQEVPDHMAPADARALAATLVAGEGIA